MFARFPQSSPEFIVCLYTAAFWLWLPKWKSARISSSHILSLPKYKWENKRPISHSWLKGNFIPQGPISPTVQMAMNSRKNKPYQFADTFDYCHGEEDRAS
jgi:hypothetical protein